MNWLATLSPFGKKLHKTIELSGKPIQVTCTARAMRTLSQRHEPLIVEMELAFACFARKSVHFHEQPADRQLTFVTDKLAVFFRSVIPDHCDASGETQSPANALSVIPRWLKLDYVNGAWRGEYGL